MECYDRSVPNLISFKTGTVFWGHEILYWMNYNIYHHTSLEKEAKRLHAHYGYTLRPEHMYSFYRGQERDRGPEVFMIRRVH